MEIVVVGNGIRNEFSTRRTLIKIGVTLLCAIIQFELNDVKKYTENENKADDMKLNAE